MVAFYDSLSGDNRSEADKAADYIHEEKEKLGRERMDEIVWALLTVVREQLESQMEGVGEEKGMWLNPEDMDELLGGVHSEFFGA